MANMTISAGFVLFFSALYFFDSSGIFSALIPAALIHELGHVAAIKIMRGEITGLHLEISGVRMDYSAALDLPSECIVAAFGPLFGLALTVAASALGKVFSSEYLLCVSGVSLSLSLFNLLPALPLDGGRMLWAVTLGLFGYNRAKAILLVCGLLVASVVTGLGIWLASRGFGISLIVSGFWIGVLGTNSLARDPVMV